MSVYDPGEFSLEGKIVRVFPLAGDRDKMYFLDRKHDPETDKWFNVTLEINTRT